MTKTIEHIDIERRVRNGIGRYRVMFYIVTEGRTEGTVHKSGWVNLLFDALRIMKDECDFLAEYDGIERGVNCWLQRTGRWSA